MNQTYRLSRVFRYSRMCFIVACVAGSSACASRVYYTEPPLMPVAVEPANGAVLSNGNPVNFVWRESADSERYEFHIFDRTSSDIQRYYRSDLTPAALCAAGICSMPLNLAMPEDTGHAWRVRAYNSAGYSAWSRTVFEIRQ